MKTFRKQTMDLTCAMIISILSILAMTAATATSSVHTAAHIHRGLNEDYLECTVHKLEALALSGVEDEPSNRLSCSAKDHGPTVLLQGNHEEFFPKGFASGVTSLRIPSYLVSGNLQVNLDGPVASETIVILDGDRMGGLRGAHNARSLRADFDGTFKVLVVRVSDKNGHSPSDSAEDISRHVFTGDLTMSSQYRACSNDILKFDPADGSDVVNGVLDLEVDIDLSMTWSSEECVNAADDAISSSSFNINTYTYTMYICPSDVDFGVAAGVADVNGYKSWYLDRYGSMPFVQMHELGHNLSFYHSNEGEREYGDPTGIMGGSFVEGPEWGRMCFNAAKTYTAGWYSNHHGDVSPNLAPYNGNIVDVNSASLGLIGNREDVVVRVKTRNNLDVLYFMLHRLEGITSDMFPGSGNENYLETHANKVNVIRQTYPSGSSSKLVAHLASGEEFIQNNWDGSGKALHIKVCSIANSSKSGGAKVIVYLEGDTLTSCDDDGDGDKNTLSPTSSPTSPPTKATKPPPPSCIDSELKMFIRGGAKKSCQWVATNNTEERCLIPGVASHCPVTCGTCISCTDSGKRFQMKNEAKDIKSCKWVRNAKTKARCKKEGVASACRATCGTCTT